MIHQSYSVKSHTMSPPACLRFALFRLGLKVAQTVVVCLHGRRQLLAAREVAATRNVDTWHEMHRLDARHVGVCASLEAVCSLGTEEGGRLNLMAMWGR